MAVFSFTRENAANTSGGSTTSITVHITNSGPMVPIAAGATVIVAVAYQTEANVPSVTDPQGNIYALVNLPGGASGIFTDPVRHWGLAFFYHQYAASPNDDTIILNLSAGTALKGVWPLEYQGLDLSSFTPTVAWNTVVAPGTGANAILSAPLSPASALPFLAVGLCMDVTGTLGGLATKGGGAYNNRNASWTFIPGNGFSTRMEDATFNSTNAERLPFTAGVGTDTYYTGQVLFQQAFAPNTFKVNPLGLIYRNQTNGPLYEHPSAMLITGQERHASGWQAFFQTARAAGAEVLAYLDASEVPDTPQAGDATIFYAGATLWPLPTYGARKNFPNTHLADISVGSAWTDKVVAYITQLMLNLANGTPDAVDGVLFDVCGAQLYDNALNSWTLTPQVEKDMWTNGQIDLMRRLDVIRRAISPNFLLVNNGYWDRGDSLGPQGEQYVDGNMMEHPAVNAYHILYASHTFSNLGHRRVLVIARSNADALLWRLIQGVTNVSDQSSAQYGNPNPPVGGFNPVSDRNLPIPPGPPPPNPTGPNTSMWDASGNYRIDASGKGGYDASGYEPVPLAVAVADAAALGVNIGPVTVAYNTLVPIGFVVTGYPPLIKAALAGSYVPVVISQGPAPPPNPPIAPNVVGLYYYDAQLNILASGLCIDTPIFELSTTVQPGYVLRQSLPAGQHFDAPTQVRIVVSGFPVQNQGQAPIAVP